MIARTIPSATPITIESTVRRIVTQTPWRTRGSNRYWPTTSQWKFGLSMTARMSDAATMTMITAAIQRPMWRTGTALISSGRPGCCSVESSEVLTSSLF